MVKRNDWFDLFKRGDEQAFRHAFEKYYQPVSYFAFKILNGDSYAEDIVSESFRKAWEARGKFDTEKHLENFLYLVTRNACISQLRAERVAATTVREWVHLAAEAEADTTLDLEHTQARLISILHEKLNSLPGGDVLRMSYLEGKSTREIAKELNTTENNVYIVKSRALKMLRSMLSKNDWLLFVLFFLHSSRFSAVDMQHDGLSSFQKHVALSPGLRPGHPNPGKIAYRH